MYPSPCRRSGLPVPTADMLPGITRQAQRPGTLTPLVAARARTAVSPHTSHSACTAHLGSTWSLLAATNDVAMKLSYAGRTGDAQFMINAKALSTGHSLRHSTWEGRTKVDAPRVCQVGAQGLQGGLHSKHQPVLKVPLERCWCAQQCLNTDLTRLFQAIPFYCWQSTQIQTFCQRRCGGKRHAHAVPHAA